MNANSLLAIEYLNVLNMEIPSSECERSPIIATTTEITTISTTEAAPTQNTNVPTASTSTSETPVQSSTVVNDPPAPAADESFLGVSNRLWKILIPVLSFIILILLCALIYAILWYRTASDKLQLIDELDSTAKEPYNPSDAISNYSNQTTLPRLKVINDKDNGISIISIERPDVTHFESKSTVS